MPDHRLWLKNENSEKIFLNYKPFLDKYTYYFRLKVPAPEALFLNVELV
jgi:hypothetical protein